MVSVFQFCFLLLSPIITAISQTQNIFWRCGFTKKLFYPFHKKKEIQMFTFKKSNTNKKNVHRNRTMGDFFQNVSITKLVVCICVFVCYYTQGEVWRLDSALVFVWVTCTSCLKGRFQVSRCGMGLRICISSRLPTIHGLFYEGIPKLKPIPAALSCHVKWG